MFLEKSERAVIIVLVFTLLLGASVLYYKKMSVSNNIRTGKFSREELVSQHNIDSELYNMRRININEAGPDQLARLDGVGPALAGRIVKYRSATGRFSSVEDVMKVKGIGKAVFEKIKEYIVVD